VAGVLLAAALVSGVVRFALGPQVPVYPVIRMDLIQTIVASGRVMNPLRVEIGSQITGTVARVPVSEGQAVKTGQSLVELEADELVADVKQARFAVRQGETRVRQIREVALPAAEQNLNQGQANLLNARKQYERTAELRAQGFVGQAQLDDAKRTLDVYESQVLAARIQVATNRPGGSDSVQASMALEQARANLQIALAKLEHATIRAPADGTLIARDVERGDVVQPGKALMVLSPTGETQIVLQIDERNLGKLKLGQRAIASADAYAAQKFAAELVYINPGIDIQRGTVEVKLRVPNPPEYLRQDMTVSVDIEIERRAHALTLPAQGVRDATGPSPWVLRVKNGRATRQAVKLGVRGEGAVEVVEGLEAGDLVVAAGNSVVKAGQRVRPIPHE
jgi:HlyD family secretion protein